MLKVKKIETKFGEQKSEHTFYYQSDATCLVVIFPGGGNSCNRPILHYSRKFLLDLNCDVLNISYTNLADEEDSVEVQMEKLISSVYTPLSLFKIIFLN